MRQTLPSWRAEDVGALVDRLHARETELSGALVQDNDAIVRQACRALGLTIDGSTTVAVGRAMCVPAPGRIAMFDGARELLACFKALNLRSVVVSNAIWRAADDYRSDFAGFGVSQHVDTILSSVDVRFRKPHRRIFHAAVRAAGRPPEECLMIGDSEEKDVQPALALGMRAIRVAIEEPPPLWTAAEVCARSLDEVAAILPRLL